ncbi:MAG: TlpA family protein disulfide reductase [Gammaproteobacteria bacterium]|nr:TlpA family protein disulfide reductase [Gammaproteobacteria bacterium]
MNIMARRLILFVGFPILIAGNAYFYFTEKAKQLPEVEFTLLDGNKLSLDALRGKPVLLNFWATSCEPCRKEIPELIELYREFSLSELKVIGIAMSHDRPDQVIAFKQAYKIPYDIALDINSTIASAFDVQVIPVTLLITPRGQIAYRHNGIIDLDNVRKRIAAMLPDKRG